MCAARNFPPANDTVQQISISYVNATLTLTPQGVIIAAGEQVSFVNSAGSQGAISITFNPNPPSPPTSPTMFNNISNLQPGSSQTQTAPNTNGSVNYTVTAGGNSFGPYAIQVGIGPLYIQISNNDCEPGIAAIPPRGMLLMYSTDSGSKASYNVLWPGSGAGPFTPPIQTAAGGMQNNVASAGSATVGQYSYTVSKPPLESPGGGKVIIRGT